MPRPTPAQTLRSAAVTTARPARHSLVSRAITKSTALPALRKRERSGEVMSALTTRVTARVKMTARVKTRVKTMLTAPPVTRVGATSAESARASAASYGATKPTAPDVHNACPRQAHARRLGARAHRPLARARQVLSRRLLARQPLARRVVARRPLARPAFSRRPLARPLARGFVARRVVNRRVVNRRGISRRPLARRPLACRPLARRVLTQHAAAPTTSTSSRPFPGISC